MTRLSSGYPKWYEEYNFKDSSYGELKGYQALRKALEELVDNKGNPTLKKNGEPYAIFEKINRFITDYGSEKIIKAAGMNPADVLAERDTKLGPPPLAREPIDTMEYYLNHAANAPTKQNLLTQDELIDKFHKGDKSVTEQPPKAEVIEPTRPITPEEAVNSQPDGDLPPG